VFLVLLNIFGKIIKVIKDGIFKTSYFVNT